MERSTLETDLPVPVTATAKSIRIALVEDDASVRGILRGWVEETDGMQCVGDWGDAETAIGGVTTVAPDVAMVDINLPGLNGIEFVRRLKLLLPATQFLMLTVYDDTDHIFDALAAGATGYLVKRTPRESLIAAVREVRAGGSPMSTNIARKVVQAFQQPRPPQPQRAAEGLSPREIEVLALVAKGYLYKEISDSIGISLPTVNTYIRRIYEKLHVHSRSQAVARFTHWTGRP
jgi:DNA-binding NarL/FixJ family response regulator